MNMKNKLNYQMNNLKKKYYLSEINIPLLKKKYISYYKYLLLHIA